MANLGSIKNKIDIERHMSSYKIIKFIKEGGRADESIISIHFRFSPFYLQLALCTKRTLRWFIINRLKIERYKFCICDSCKLLSKVSQFKDKLCSKRDWDDMISWKVKNGQKETETVSEFNNLVENFSGMIYAKPSIS